MIKNRVAPELDQIYRYLPPIPFHKPRVRSLARTLIRAASGRKRYQGVSIDQREEEHLNLRVFEPVEGHSGAGIIWLHGGGFMIGSAAQDDQFCAGLCRDLGLIVVSVGYRLAPEHPFPAALEDCILAWDWIQSAAPELGLDQSRVAVAGQSAGGGLAACLTQSLLDRGGIQPAAQLLIYPMLDDRTAADRSLDQEMHPLWNNNNNRGGWEAYLGRESGLDYSLPYAVASRRKDLSGLPSAWIGVGDIDLFYTEDCAYAERLEKAGVDCTLEIFTGAPHGFNVVAPGAEVTRSFQQSVNDFLARQLEIE